MRHLAWLAILPLTLSMLAVRPVSPVGTLRPFLGYRAKTTRKTAKFVKVSGVQLSDDFEAGRFDVIKTGDFLVATADVGAGVALAQRTHLRAYKIKAAKGSPKHVKRLAIPVRDEIGTLRIVDTVKPELLLVPTAADPAAVPAPPNPAIDPLDHYKCYRVAIAKKTAKLPKGLRTTLTDPFTGAAKAFDVRALKHLCVPVDEAGAGIKNAALALACYTVSPTKGQPKHVAQHGLELNNHFGPLVIDTVKESEVCVAAEGPLPTPTPRASVTQAIASATPHGPATPTPLSTTIPPDPATVAPPVTRGVVSVPAVETMFLYTGSDPIQTGVAPDTIDPKRVAILRGKVVTSAGAAIAAVTVTVHDHPEFGSTRTRTDGAYDLAVNGGGPLTLELQKEGLLPTARRIEVPWQDFVMVPDVVMLAVDPAVTAITFGPNAPFQTAESSMQSDGDGARHMPAALPRRYDREPRLRRRPHRARDHATRPRHRVHRRGARAGCHAGGLAAAQRLHLLHRALGRRGDRRRRRLGRVQPAGHSLC